MKKQNYFLSLLLMVVSTFSYGQVQKAQTLQIGNTSANSTNASAALQIDDTARGLLVPRMSSTQRDAIVSPANALLIWNTSNNSFEVYKNTCSCWVAINDSGNTAATSLVNTAPTASSLNYTGIFRAGGTATIVYTYADAQNDAEGATTIQWEISNDNQGTAKTNFSTGVSATFGSTEAGRYVRAKVTPRAATGILNGIDYYGEWTQIASGTIPYGSSLSVTGTAAQGSLLTGVYTFNGGSGTENTLGSNYNWQSATTNTGQNIQAIAIPDGFTAHINKITPSNTEVGKFIRFGVKAIDNTSLSATSFVYSNWVGPITMAAEAAPTAKNVTYSPAPGTNVTLIGSYTYSDVNNDPQGTTLFKWYTADNATGTNQTAIAGATAATFTVTNTQGGKYVGFGVTPKALTGTTTGTEVVYYATTPSVALGSFSFTSVAQVSKNFSKNRVMDNTDAISVTINVTSAGAISFSTTTVNGYRFTGSGVYPTGSQTIVLSATGTQTAYNVGGDAFTITGIGVNTQTTTLTVTNVKTGADFTAHFNGITSEVSVNNLLATYSSGETFNNNSTCFSKSISASACVGTTITIGSNTYSIANINGQCWMTKNIKELPNGVAVNASQWLAASSGDLGYYGYYNTTNSTGSAGWGTTEPAAGEGLLYQWSAAMLGSTTERAQGICPTGWHIPSDCEWMYLEHGIGMSLSQQVNYAERSNTIDNQGTPSYKLRSQGSGSTNASGFSGLLAGLRANTDGSFVIRNSYGLFWTSSASSATSSIGRLITSDSSAIRGVGRAVYNNAAGYSVRCLKD